MKPHAIALLVAVIGAPSHAADKKPTRPVAPPMTATQTASAAAAASSPVDAGSMWAKQPDSFLGIKLGQRLEIPDCPMENIGTVIRIMTVNYAAMKQLTSVCRNPDDRSAPDFYNLMNLPDLGIGYSVKAHMKEGGVLRLTMESKQTNFRVLMDALEQRFGPPTSRSTTVVKNGAGAEFDAKEAFWRGDRMTISAYERLLKVDQSTVLIEDTAELARAAEAMKERRAREAQKF